MPENNEKRPALHVLTALSREAWAITPGALEAMADVAGRLSMAPDAVLTKRGERPDGARRMQVRDNVAVIPVMGPIFRHASFFTEVCGATSVASLALDISMAVDDPMVRGIVLDFDSPGGQVTGINELAGHIAAANAVKPVVAYAGGLCCSAAYWLASSTGEIVADATAELGSIGVVSTYTDTSGQDKAKGIARHEIVSSQSPNKRLPPSSEAGRAAVQTLVDGIADVFVAAVAAGRGTSAAHVLENFGQGGVMLAGPAVAVGMADRLGTLEEVIAQLAGTTGMGRLAPQANMEADMPEKEKPSTNMVDMAAVDAAWLAANKPELVAAIEADARKAGADAERARIAGIFDLGVVGHAALVAKAAFVDPLSPEAVAMAVMLADKDARAKLGQDHQDDATGVVATVPGSFTPQFVPGKKEEEASDDAAFVEAAAASMNRGREGK